MDEAHRIKGRTTSTAQACLRLRASARWGLSGTPLQNRIGDLYALVQFLRLDPHAFVYCKHGCGCRALKCPEPEEMCECGHPRSSHYAQFQRTIAAPIARYGHVGLGAQALKRLQQEVLHACVLRRTKAERADDLSLPPLTILVHSEKMSAPELDFYTALHTASKVEFDTFATSGTVVHNFATIFGLLMRLRQAADHPYLVKQTKLEDDPGICGLCSGIAVEPATAKCGHTFCRACVEAYMAARPDPQVALGCPNCYVPLSIA